MKKTILLLLHTSLICYNAFSQHKNEKFNFLFFSVDFTSNTNSFGRTNIDVKQPNFISTASFISGMNLDFSYSNIMTLNSDTTLSAPAYENDFSLGYNCNLSNDFVLYPAFTHLVHSKNSYSLYSSFSDIAQFDFLIYKPFYNSILSVNYMLGEKNMWNISAHNSLHKTFENFLFKNGVLDVELGLTINYNDLNFYNKSIYDNWSESEFLQWVEDNYNSTYYMFVRNSVVTQGLEKAKQSFYDVLNDDDPEIFSKSYKVTSLDIFLPIYYSIGNFVISFTSYLNIPVAENKFYTPSTSMLFSGGLIYTIAL